MYIVEYDRERGIVRMTLEGFWEPAMVEAMAIELAPLLRAARAQHGKARVLSDARKFPVQSSEVGLAFAMMEDEIGPLRDRMVMVVGSALSKMQGQRAVAGSPTGFFTDMTEAERWLMED